MKTFRETYRKNCTAETMLIFYLHLTQNPIFACKICGSITCFCIIERNVIEFVRHAKSYKSFTLQIVEIHNRIFVNMFMQCPVQENIRKLYIADIHLIYSLYM